MVAVTVIGHYRLTLRVTDVGCWRQLLLPVTVVSKSMLVTGHKHWLLLIAVTVDSSYWLLLYQLLASAVSC